VARILIVEDEPTDLAFIRGILELSDHEIHLAGDGEEAFKKYLRKEIEVVITDIAMPRVDGLEFIESLLALYPDAKIIAVSARGPDQLLAAKRAGATVLLSKPFGPEQLESALAEVGVG
jgi:CheY-like chemotaxis protein